MLDQASRSESVPSDWSLGWKDNRAWLAFFVFAAVIVHQLADAILPTYLNPLFCGVVISFILSLLALWFGFSLLGAHRNVRQALYRAMEGKDALHKKTSSLVQQLSLSLVETERHNEQLHLLANFNQRIHACENEQQILALVQELLPPIVQSRTGVLYCPTPEGIFKRTVYWPDGAGFENTIRRERCEALRNLSRVEGEFAPCHGCNLADPTKVSCIPLRQRRKNAGLLQLTFAEQQVRRAKRSAEDSIIQMAADQLSIALFNATARKDIGDKVMRDGLTGAFNRRYMEEALQREISRTLRSKSPLSILMLDLDHFKLLNDSMGHAAGDLVLKELAKTLWDHVRPSDIVCRYGGEEFLVALPDTSSLAAKGRADELRRHIHEISKVVKHHHAISASIGVAAMPEHGSDLKTLLKAADNALYDAKHSGRDRTVIANRATAHDVIEPSTRWTGFSLDSRVPVLDSESAAKLDLKVAQPKSGVYGW